MPSQRWTWWYMLVISVPGGQRQENGAFKSSLKHMRKPCSKIERDGVGVKGKCGIGTGVGDASTIPHSHLTVLIALTGSGSLHDRTRSCAFATSTLTPICLHCGLPIFLLQSICGVAGSGTLEFSANSSVHTHQRISRAPYSDQVTSMERS